MDTIEDVLAHHGIKGMKWGVRNDTVAVSSVNSRSQIDGGPMVGTISGHTAPTKADVQGLTKATTNAMRGIRSAESKQKLNSLNTDFISKHPTGKWTADIAASYNNQVTHHMEVYANKYLKSPLAAGVMLAPGGKMALVVGSRTGVATFKTSAVHHADEIGVMITMMTPTRNSSGFITDFVEEDSMMQSDSDTIEDVLAHHGIKGMKWGVRRKNPSASSGLTIKTASGEVHLKPGDRIVTPDARAAHDARKLARDFGVSSLTNAQLKSLNERVQMEQKYAQLFPKKKSMAQKGASFAVKMLAEIGQQQAKAYVNKQIGIKLAGPPEIGKHSKR